MNLEIKQNTFSGECNGRWYISDGDDNYLWQDLKIHCGTGFFKYGVDRAPGYYYSEKNAQITLQKFKEKNMNFKIGDEVNVINGLYSFGIYGDKSCGSIPLKSRDNLTVIGVGLSVIQYAGGCKNGEYSEVCDLMVTNGDFDYWYTQSRFCKPVYKKIKIRYFSDGKDVTDKISDETKRNLV